MFSKHSPKGSLFKANLARNTAELIKIPEKDSKGNAYSDSPLEIPTALVSASNIASAKIALANVAVPSVGFKYAIKYLLWKNSVA